MRWIKLPAVHADLAKGQVWRCHNETVIKDRPVVVLSALPAESAANRLVKRLLIAPLTSSLGRFCDDDALVTVGRNARAPMHSLRMVKRKRLFNPDGMVTVADPDALATIDDAAYKTLVLGGSDAGIHIPACAPGDIYTLRPDSVSWPRYSDAQPPTILVISRVASHPGNPDSATVLGVPLQGRPGTRLLEIATAPGEIAQLSHLKRVFCAHFERRQGQVSDGVLADVRNGFRELLGRSAASPDTMPE